MNAFDVGLPLARLTRDPVESVEKIGNGGNSKVYRIQCRNGATYAAKFYFQRTADGQDRLQVELAALRFLWESGVRCIPRPLAADPAAQIALFEYVRGGEIGPGTVTARDLDQAVAFADMLKRLGTLDASAGLPLAAEACFSGAAVVDNVKARLVRLEATQRHGEIYNALRCFLRERFAPALARLTGWARAEQGKAAFGVELAPRLRTLSPSDFGFHNAIRRESGELVFVDFEYFGWDDPAKMIADFLLHPHPAMQLARGQRQAFVAAMLGCFGEGDTLRQRLRAVYPLFGLKWCMILLNDFRAESIERRKFLGYAAREIEAIQTGQLSKAEHMLDRVLNEYEEFPRRV